MPAADTAGIRGPIMQHPPCLITFDIFGTVLDWRSGLEQACAAAGRKLGPGEFDRIVNEQAAL